MAYTGRRRNGPRSPLFPVLSPRTSQPSVFFPPQKKRRKSSRISKVMDCFPSSVHRTRAWRQPPALRSPYTCFAPTLPDPPRQIVNTKPQCEPVILAPRPYPPPHSLHPDAADNRLDLRLPGTRAVRWRYKRCKKVIRTVTAMQGIRGVRASPKRALYTMASHAQTQLCANNACTAS